MGIFLMGLSSNVSSCDVESREAEVWNPNSGHALPLLLLDRDDPLATVVVRWSRWSRKVFLVGVKYWDGSKHSKPSTPGEHHNSW